MTDIRCRPPRRSLPVLAASRHRCESPFLRRRDGGSRWGRDRGRGGLGGWADDRPPLSGRRHRRRARGGGGPAAPSGSSPQAPPDARDVVLGGARRDEDRGCRSPRRSCPRARVGPPPARARSAAPSSRARSGGSSAGCPRRVGAGLLGMQAPGEREQLQRVLVLGGPRGGVSRQPARVPRISGGGELAHRSLHGLDVDFARERRAQIRPASASRLATRFVGAASAAPSRARRDPPGRCAGWPPGSPPSGGWSTRMPVGRRGRAAPRPRRPAPR